MSNEETISTNILNKIIDPEFEGLREENFEKRGWIECNQYLEASEAVKNEADSILKSPNLAGVIKISFGLGGHGDGSPFQPKGKGLESFYTWTIKGVDGIGMNEKFAMTNLYYNPTNYICIKTRDTGNREYRLLPKNGVGPIIIAEEFEYDS